MNERIRELLEQAGVTYVVMPEDTVYEKFAKLIVRECIQVAVNKNSGYIHPANVAGYMAAGRSTAAQMIKQHFGIEE